ncbi:uncharacterized protein GIQ15_01850 [Arthroderma uncinatum]|uniref:uncharacterized protein n=1 Tax=Arthroderma uncinatum TaxID=74035 RepID=UPI00144A9D8F|nr:uncharacterized protein GIQ15_01850 [Arthroderma uncinatum]KAF3492333.1 hypothetical protein GIQ15_01850 [Arthroderma uncinatum]
MADATTHDDGLSPASKKILKECTIEMPTALVKDSRVSFVARPPSSGEHNPGFHFARPTLPRRAFTSHPQARCAQTATERTTNQPSSQEDKEAVQLPDVMPRDETAVEEDISHEDREKTKSPERARTTSILPEIEISRESVLEPPQPTEDNLSAIAPKNTEDTLPVDTLQPTEVDLFKLLMHRLKKREEAEAAASKLRDELKASLHEADRNNKLLKLQFHELEEKYREQQVGKAAQNQAVERWKTKFGKIRGLMAGIADHQERLLRNCRLIRKEQVSLNVERDQIHDSLNYLTESSKGIGKNISQYKAQLTGVIHQFTAEEDALNVLLQSKESKLKDMERTLEEMNRAMEDAKAQACRADSERLTLELSSKEMEKRIREELSRASLMSKDQDRARFEQEKHTLMREKQSAEGNVVKVKKELEAAQANLAEISANNASLLVTLDTYKKKLDIAEKEHEAVASAHEKAVLALREHRDLHTTEEKNIQEQLVGIQKENSALKQENAAILADNVTINAEKATIQKDNAALEQEITAIKKEKAALELEHTAILKENGAIKAENTAIQKENAVIKAENTAIQKENADVKAENVTIQEENNRLKAGKQDRGSEAPAESINTPSNSNDGPVKKEKGEATLKGILKETQPVTASSVKRTAQFHTPSRDTKRKRSSIAATAPRRQSRVSSRFFDPQPTPSPSLSVITSQQDTTWTVNQSVDTFMTQSSVQSRKRRREDTFNNRFGQKHVFQ